MRKDSRRTLARLASGFAASWFLLIGGTLPATAAQAAGKRDNAAPLAVVTIVDGKARMLRGEQRLQFSEGSRLLSQDVIETEADARVVRIEFDDGLAVNLGPSTRLLIDPQFHGERGRFARLYLLSGWIKLKAGPAAPAGQATADKPIPLLASPAIDVYGASGSIVSHVDDSKVSLFVESGSAQIRERLNAKPLGQTQALRSGQFLSRAGKAKSTLSGRPAAGFIDSMPRSFLDTLPDRAALFKDRKSPPKAVGDITYDDARDWLSVEWTLRRPAMNRWRPLTRDAAFRKALITNMKAHPEWDRVLFPEKYQRGN